MRFAWVGGHAEGIPALTALLEAGAPIHAVLTLRPDLAAKRSSIADYRPVCDLYHVPLYFIANINEVDTCRILSGIEPDVVFVIGWHQIVRPATLRRARIGMIGAHASLLPHNRGSAPINWALIRGERETGSTLYWLSDHVDAVRVIDQMAFPITPYDTCATLYQQVALSNREMLLRLLPRIMAGERPGQPMARTGEPPLRRRRPADGGIDWSWTSRGVYDFIRALTRPFAGAFANLDGQRWWIWHAGVSSALQASAPPGTVLAPVVSPVADACGQQVACGKGSVVLLEVQDESGHVLRGRALSEQPWTGKVWEKG
jgi:methionyl-tRNA formyltransferase